MAKVSVIITCYKSVAFLSAAIDSVLRQDLTDWELVLIDDGSPDTTWDIIRRYTQLDSRIRGYRIENGGTSKARNYGYSKTDPSSPYIFFLDHDDQLEPGALSRMCAYLDVHSDVGLLACQYQDVSFDGRHLGTGWRSRWAPGRFFPRQLGPHEIETPFVTFFCATGQGPFAMHRRSVYARTDGWEISLWPHEDTDLFCQMALLAKVHFLPDRMYLKRVHPEQGSADHEKVQRRYEIFRAKWDRRQPRNGHEAALLRHARTYYYAMHRPLRDMKYAAMHFSLFCTSPGLNHLLKGMARTFSAVQGWVLHLPAFVMAVAAESRMAFHLRKESTAHPIGIVGDPRLQ